MEKFSLEKYLENPNRKVVTRQGKSVRIICTNRRHTDSWPIVALEDYGDGEFVIYANIDGRTDMCSENIHDLFFADEKEELTEFEKELQTIISEASHWTSDDGSISTYCYFGDKEIKKISGQILDLARKELQPEFDKEMDKMLAETDKVVYQKGQQDALKGLPKWKKVTEHKLFNHYVCVMTNNSFPFIFLEKEVHIGDYYYIDLEDLKNLPKEE